MGPHARELGDRVGLRDDLSVGDRDGLLDRRRDGVVVRRVDVAAVELPGDDVDGHPARLLAAELPAHAVGDQEQPAGVQREFLEVRLRPSSPIRWPTIRGDRRVDTAGKPFGELGDGPQAGEEEVVLVLFPMVADGGHQARHDPSLTGPRRVVPDRRIPRRGRGLPRRRPLPESIEPTRPCHGVTPADYRIQSLPIARGTLYLSLSGINHSVPHNFGRPSTPKAARSAQPFEPHAPPYGGSRSQCGVLSTFVATQ